MLLRDLIRKFQPEFLLSKLPDVDVTGIREDSRRFAPATYLLPAPAAGKTASRFLSDAQGRGAVAALVQSSDRACSLPQVPVANPSAAASVLANLFYGQLQAAFVR